MKKLYKNILLQLMAVCCLFNLVACQEFNIDSQPEAPLNIQIDALDSYSVLATSPSNVVFNISANTPWTIDCDQQWCKVTPTMSASSSLVSEVVVVIESNETSKSRSAQLTISAEGVEGKKVITLNQASKENLVVIPYDEIVPTEGGQISFNLISNKPWEIIPSTHFLENMDKTSGTGSETGEKETVTLTIPANTAARRTGNITVKTAFEEFTFSIMQDGIVIEQETPSESGVIEFNGNVGEQIIKVRANTTWKPEVPEAFQSWISVEKVSETELKVLVKDNNRLVTRKGEIVMKSEKLIPGFEGVVFTVAQRPNFWLDVPADKMEIDEATGNVKIMKVGGNSVNSHYAFKKGRLVFELADLNLTGTARLVFNMWPDAGNSNFHFWLRSDKACQYTCGGGFEWQQVTFKLTTEEANAVRKVEFVTEDDPENVGKLRLRLLVDGVEKGVLKNKTNVFVANPANNPGQKIYISLADAPADNYFTVKSITHYPAE